jgi:ribosome biogenesis GTPase
LTASASRFPELSLVDLGWDDGWTAAFAGFATMPDVLPARVSRADRGVCTVLSPEPMRVVNGREAIATGDWVVVGPGPLPGDRSVVAAILPRRTAFVRQRPGSESSEQVVAANVDTVLVVNALDTPLSPRRIERYLALVWQSGAVPVVVLTKADCCPADELAGLVQQTQAVGLGVDVVAVSAASGAGIEDLATTYLSVGRTAALLGPSGSGKSTLVNLLAGAMVMTTGDTRRDGKGRHTTSHRELVVVPGRGLLLDTPGMRGLAMWDADEGLSQTFADVEDLIVACRFSNCSHTSESGCAVLAALRDGSLPYDRLAGWRKLQQELRSLAARQGDRAAQYEKRQRRKAVAKANKRGDSGRDR